MLKVEAARRAQQRYLLYLAGVVGPVRRQRPEQQAAKLRMQGFGVTRFSSVPVHPLASNENPNFFLCCFW